MKVCSRCKRLLPEALFHKNRTTRDGLQYHCKDCRKERKTTSRKANHRKLLAQEAGYRERNRERLRVYHRAYCAMPAHKERIREQQAACKRRHKKRIDASNAQYRETHREEHKRANASWYARNQGRYNSYRHERLARMRGSNAVPIDRRAIFERDGWVCQLCGGAIDPECQYPSPQSPSLDHIVPLAKGGSHTQGNVQAAHLFCNMRKFIN